MRINIFIIPLTLLLSLSTCERSAPPFEISKNLVQEGDYTARVISPTQMTSDYSMNLDHDIKQPIIFKLSINGRDNEAGFGKDHQLVIPQGITEYFAPTLRFGEYAPVHKIQSPALDQTTNVYFRVDLRPVLRNFSERGFYITPTADTVTASEFEGLYLAGGESPMEWIWDQMEPSDELLFNDADLDSIYELKVTFEPEPTQDITRSWELSSDLSNVPQFSSPEAPILEALTNMAMEEAILNIREDSSFSAGKEWRGVWTRDVSYAAQLSLAYLFPENVKTSLRAKLSNSGRIIQDTGTGGSWPVSSDRHVWTLAAWEVFLATGDSTWLEEIKGPVIQALKEDLIWNRDPVSGMLLGETSFEDWREQTYAPWMTPADIHSSHALSTNIIFKRALEIGLGLAQNDQDINRSWPQLIMRLDRNIINHFWSSELGGPASYIITSPSWQAASHRDLLGESLGILFGNSFSQMDSQLVVTYPRTSFGSPVISHQLAHSPPYHNQSVWPFVEAYALLAAKQAGQQTEYRHSFNSLIRASALYLSHRENFQYLNGRPDQTEINSDRQLWSVAGWLSAIYKGLFGIAVNYNFDNQVFELDINPNNPFEWDNFTLSNLKIHGTEININLKGEGSLVSALFVNGESVEPGEAFSLLGEALNVEVHLRPEQSQISRDIITANFTSPSIPISSWQSDTLTWRSSTDLAVIEYNGRRLDTLIQSPVIIPDTLTGFFSLRTLDSLGHTSLPAVPHYRGPSALLVLNTSEPYFVELGKENKFIKMSFNLPISGNYLVHFIYSNGSGPISSGNTCGLAQLKVNDWWLEQMISFPHTDDWDNWQVTSWAKAKFNSGLNTIVLDQEALPVNNMDGVTNLFRVKEIEIIPIVN